MEITDDKKCEPEKRCYVKTDKNTLGFYDNEINAKPILNEKNETPIKNLFFCFVYMLYFGDI